MKLSVVVPTWNAADLASRAVSVLKTPDQPAGTEVLVVDDGSTDNSLQRLAEELPGVRLIARPRNGGFGAAVNTGFRESHGGYLAILNNDALATWDCLLGLTRFLEATPSAAAAAPRLLYPDGSHQRVAFDLPRPVWSSAARRLVRLGRFTVEADTPFPAEYLRGACVVFRRMAIEPLAFFDEAYRMFAEEIDLFRRLHDRGWTSWVVPTTTAIHDGGRSSRSHPDPTRSSLYRRQSYWSMCRYIRKHHRGLVAGAMHAGLLASAILRAVSGAWRGERALARDHLVCAAVVIRPGPIPPLES